MRTRRAAVAGYFYPSNPDELKESIKSSFLSRVGPGKLPPSEHKADALGYIVPHAGYEYSGPVAAHAYYEISAINDNLTFIILGPNHYGIGSPIAVPQSDEWETPIGTVEVDEILKRDIIKESNIIDVDDSAHWREHSIEVQVPFLQYVMKEFKILPISMSYMEMGAAVDVAETISRAIKGKKIMIIASSDMTHYESQSSVREKDNEAINAITSLDVSGLYRAISHSNITMCGYGPAAVLMHLSGLMGYSWVNLLKHSDSGEMTGDTASVVGYASIGFYKK
ncbi:MAG: AmmeMemoRadiSam system protein B [Nitrososphaerota archaeon]|nr:AmmeMemoRadiSam system protein B [Nitrososphaerota archaeon]MDG6931654.1 AmmeMemoRadiSam system protein B [Nitrososphaerota archaeon]MDG6936904.1 AmmeMemoRadiSam system protein B [Nitrososphaerota archaeon]MDG6944372.1 AmmeMemoRadiSam system protein B [Nitrososphaerota archaeon]